MTPLISVVVPCFRQAHFLAAAIKSLQNQSHENWEAWIVDDGSPDDTYDIATELSRADPRVRYLRKANGGLSDARNFGIEHAQGQYLQFLDADDVLYPTKFAIQLAATADPDKTVCYSDYDNLQHATLAHTPRRMDCVLRNRHPLLDFAGRWEHDLSIPIHTALFPRTAFGPLACRFDARLKNHEDWDVWMWMAHQQYRFLFQPEVLCSYRHTSHGMSKDASAMLAGFQTAIALWKDRGMERDAVKALAYLESCTEHAYGATWKGALYGLTRTPWWRELPWPMQTRLKALLARPAPSSLRLGSV